MRTTIAIIYKAIVKPLLFQFDPETVHDNFLRIGDFLGKSKLTKLKTRLLFCVSNSLLTQRIDGITFNNPVGLSAGFDKDAALVNILPDIGFGFAQIGSVTANAYEGNPKPRLIRLKKSRGILVNYGLKNIGVDAIVAKFNSKYPSPQIPISISVAKTNCKDVVTPKQGIDDYVTSLEKLTQNNVGSLYTINISCPNTFGGEPFTTPQILEQLLSSIDTLEIPKPVWIKMPISILNEEFLSLCEVAKQHRISGLVIGNLQKDRTDQSIIDVINPDQKGGISGKPTWNRSNELISLTYTTYHDRFVIIGCGGIFSAQDAYVKIKNGASLVQLITGMIFMGPQLIGQINQGLLTLIKKDGYTNISQAIGANHKN
ncbi:quinone-dependent dihydroorotate dehydrogenase [candidate division WWE3 bacterium CG_4_9_14_3_um_filter_41_6]|uniref:Dihydroorotate dehydrogenase (quinone) n=1 Tax=candidate division WWE3 bacterium CG_4_10_14_0_2_um_filter_41_14 TaxID=1975072 RepID=A0A2M7TKY9_UNCKA|nr:MAG: quinone-dependent dihydroorotate dehydrogenase [candidate division WWE3 bacterium CG_4_10_14_0_2_um_filter_41_14]PJA39528.1 MAG: quinone-dependent dihydroorotate dehydrogenase [candidate division WWE3 bacterium CG_4_9_14_3_um_filter_41_6]